MRYKYLYISYLIWGYVLLSTFPGHTQGELPFHQIGVLDAIFLQQQRIVIYDTSFDLPQDTPVYRFKKNVDNTNPDLRQVVSQKDLKLGMRLGYTAVYNQGTQNRRVIQEIWILPPGKFASIE
jgi:hypothetical protein